jgi:hypothetical protein
MLLVLGPMLDPQDYIYTLRPFLFRFSAHLWTTFNLWRSMVQFELLHTQSDSSAGWKWMAWYGLMLTSVSLLIFSPSPQWCTPVRRVDERITESVHINTSTVRNFVLDQLMSMNIIPS